MTRLEYEMREQRITAEQLANLPNLAVTGQTIRRWMKGESIPLKKAALIAEYLKISLDDLNAPFNIVAK